ncbi:MAG: transporter permease [Verrucomicrobiales bacterium]|nr:transporter permease [Verrucomicrobiales bacterium]
MNEFLQQVINGVSLGAIYALIALGYTMVYGVLKFINFAHSDVFMIGAFSAFYAVQKYPSVFVINSWPGGALVIFTVMALCALLGMVIELLAYRPLRNKPRLSVLITAIGVSLLIENLAQLQFGAAPQHFPDLLPVTIIHLGNLSISSTKIVVIGVAAFLLVALEFIVRKTKIGVAMRAVSFNHQTAALMGVNVDLVISFTFGLGSALAGAGGVLYSLSYPAVEPFMGIMPGLKAFVAAVLGGIGNIPGAALGGLLLGIIETFVKGSHYSTFTDAIAFAILILILLFRPAGLLGKVQIEKV